MSKLDHQTSKSWKIVRQMNSKLLVNLTIRNTEYLIAQLRARFWQKVLQDFLFLPLPSKLVWLKNPYLRCTPNYQISFLVVTFFATSYSKTALTPHWLYFSTLQRWQRNFSKGLRFGFLTGRQETRILTLSKIYGTC